MEASQNIRILIVIPAYNESGNIPRILREVRESCVDTDILVVDDGSTDATAAEARRTDARVVTLPFNLGVGGAVQTGLIFAQKRDYDVAVQVDGDGQHDPRYLADLLAPVLSGETDISVGSRFINPYVGYRSSFVRRIGINFFARLISALTRYRVTDPTSGFRAFNRKAIAVFAEDYPVDYPEPESIVLAQRYGLRLREVPVQMRERGCGLSSIRYLKTLYYMTKVTVAILLDMIKKKVVT